jgi:hypothetical protein
MGSPKARRSSVTVIFPTYEKDGKLRTQLLREELLVKKSGYDIRLESRDMADMIAIMAEDPANDSDPVVDDTNGNGGGSS